jgi:hypothetical protein
LLLLLYSVVILVAVVTLQCGCRVDAARASSSPLPANKGFMPKSPLQRTHKHTPINQNSKPKHAVDKDNLVNRENKDGKDSAGGKEKTISVVTATKKISVAVEASRRPLKSTKLVSAPREEIELEADNNLDTDEHVDDEEEDLDLEEDDDEVDMLVSMDKRTGKLVDADDGSPIVPEKKDPTLSSSTTAGAAFTTLKRYAFASGKLCRSALKTSYDLVAVKHVTLQQILGKWNLEQQIALKEDVILDVPAVLELFRGHQVSLICNGIEHKSEFEFEERYALYHWNTPLTFDDVVCCRSWPRRCTVEFRASVTPHAGHRSNNQAMQLHYRGHFKRSMMNPNIVLLRGKIYKTEGSFL